MNKTTNSNKPKNFDNVEPKDLEAYMKAGIIEFWAIVRTAQDQSQLIQLSNKYNYGHYATAFIDLDEVIKRGATFQDRTKQMKNENLSVLMEVV